MTPRGLGCIHDSVQRGEVYSAGGLRFAAPAAVDWSSKVDDCAHYDQGMTSSCVGHALANAIVLCQRVAGGDSDAIRPSALHIYDMARGPMRADVGTTIFQAADATARLGYLLEPERPWNPWDIDSRVAWGKGHTSVSRAGMKHHRIVGDRQLLVMQLIANGFGVAIGMDVGPAFQDWPAGQIYRGEPHIAGGHAMAVTGYDQDCVRLINSWGRGFCEGGFVRVGWDYIEDVARTRSLWAIDAVPSVGG